MIYLQNEIQVITVVYYYIVNVFFFAIKRENEHCDWKFFLK